MNPTNQPKSYYQIKRSHNAQGRNGTAEDTHPGFQTESWHELKGILKFFKGIKT